MANQNRYGKPADYVRFIRGTPTAWHNLKEKDDDTLYFISEKDADFGYLYLGDKLISGGGGDGSGVDATLLGRISALEKREDKDTNQLKELLDVALTQKITDGSSLVYDAKQKKWVNKIVSSGNTTPVVAGAEELRDLKDISLSIEISDGSILTYDAAQKKWTNTNITLPKVMKGASESSNGESGLVPAPQFYDANKYLRGDGKWVDPTAELTVELFKLRMGDTGSIREIAASEVLKIVGSNVPTQYNTIEKIANWIVQNGTSIESTDGAARLNALEQAVYGADKTSSTDGLIAVSKQLVTTIYGDPAEYVEGLTSVCSRIDVDNMRMKNDITQLQKQYNTLNTTVIDLDGRLTWKKFEERSNNN